jgi:hypothetical protein
MTLLQKKLSIDATNCATKTVELLSKSTVSVTLITAKDYVLPH